MCVCWHPIQHVFLPYTQHNLNKGTQHDPEQDKTASEDKRMNDV